MVFDLLLERYDGRLVIDVPVAGAELGWEGPRRIPRPGRATPHPRGLWPASGRPGRLGQAAGGRVMGSHFGHEPGLDGADDALQGTLELDFLPCDRCGEESIVYADAFDWPEHEGCGGRHRPR